jgi:UDP-N-acetylmuramoyl-tripeptide--D-alanyl-D-alanine ligase
MAEPTLLTFRALAAAVSGDLVGPAQPAAGFSSVHIDSRAVKAGGLFVALFGSSRDGHRYAPAALEAGASGALVARSVLRGDGGADLLAAAAARGAVLVAADDTLAGLQLAAAAYLDRFPGLLKIGITGSAGKTTTKEICAAILGADRPTAMNEGNLNSETGLPLAAFTVEPRHAAGVFELGMNRRGEIGELAATLRPRIALITNVGTAHIGILGSRRAIAEEKKAVFSRFSGGETALIPASDPWADFLVDGVAGEVKRFSLAATPGLSHIADLGLDGFELTLGGRKARLALPGGHNLANAVAAIAAARAAGASDEAVRAGLDAVKPLFGRGEVFRGEVTLVRDCYNANPEAVAAAIEFCDGFAWRGRRIYVIGAMRELGEAGPAAHRALGDALAASKADAVFLFGEETAEAWKRLEAAAPDKSVFQTDDIDALRRSLGTLARPGDLVLLKGSRGTELERLTDLFAASATGGSTCS